MIGFKSLRHKLFFWFLIFVSSNFITFVLGYNFLKSREEIAELVNQVERVNEIFLEDYNAQLNFFIQETRNPLFYQSSQSAYLDKHQKLLLQVKEKLLLIKENKENDYLDFNDPVSELIPLLDEYDRLFNKLVTLVLERGFKDFGEIGEMRKAAHGLEASQTVDKTLLLSLRRHEKDFLLRNDPIYAEKVIQVLKDLENHSSANLSEKAFLENYKNRFENVVRLEAVLGLKDNTGLKLELDQKVDELGNAFSSFLFMTKNGKDKLYQDLLRDFLISGLSFVALGILLSFLIASQITRPLIELTMYINEFVNSDFSFIEGDSNSRLKDDEIGKLTLNFNIMRDKIIEQLRFFKQKVEERTQELSLANEKLVKINKANSQFVPNEFLNFLGKESIIDINLGDQVDKEMTAMFSDIRGFTAISEALSPQENFDFINIYLKNMAPLVRKNQGFIDKYIGDAIMAIFPNTTDNAIDTAIDAISGLKVFNEHLRQKGFKKINLGIGIHFGHMILGTVGTENRMETTVISDAVNTASRIEGLTKVYGCNILVSGDVLYNLRNKDKYSFRYLDKVKVKGKAKPISLFEILNGLPDREFDLKMSTKEDFNQAINAYLAQDFLKAKEGFQYLIHQSKNDPTFKFYLKRIEKYLKKGVPDEWNGAEKIYRK
ncbi:adenylate/guanylate cyclase domain-containing protein [Flexithrix dorotheae]|uniref:adenylate/guanylate cyclase domain-containing protein n=1 Tax=Flexithrix dorotheae TaxID=70993 RepID=UPI00037E6D1E|nr:adenylate/guanylate cyclase domain-containing protein [Flexithrix dorotheae]